MFDVFLFMHRHTRAWNTTIEDGKYEKWKVNREDEGDRKRGREMGDRGEGEGEREKERGR